MGSYSGSRSMWKDRKDMKMFLDKRSKLATRSKPQRDPEDYKKAFEKARKNMHVPSIQTYLEAMRQSGGSLTLLKPSQQRLLHKPSHNLATPYCYTVANQPLLKLSKNSLLFFVLESLVIMAVKRSSGVKSDNMRRKVLMRVCVSLSNKSSSCRVPDFSTSSAGKIRRSANPRSK